MTDQPELKVGIIAEPVIKFTLFSAFLLNNTGIIDAGSYSATINDDVIQLSGSSGVIISGPDIELIPMKKGRFFEVNQVTIGIDFHWEQKEDQRFTGKLRLISENGKVRLINIVTLEDYLKSVIASEMSSTSSVALLKAHAVISRSWLLAQIQKRGKVGLKPVKSENQVTSDDTIIKWYDREDHLLFDVCADDHCQRYQGITKIHSQKALQAVQETAGEVLVYNHEICDARFSKCCGGISESFENAWEPVNYPYLTSIIDADSDLSNFNLNLMQENNAENWIRNSPVAFCNTSDHNILSQVLPDFDQATTDFFRWQKDYTQEELSTLIRKKSGFDFGDIIQLDPVERGFSGRITKLKITGTKMVLTVGKELEIRKWLSPSHLYSSAFVVDLLEIKDNIPGRFILTGAGWGHGVGLCQIGAAVMGEKGYSYDQILMHYFLGSSLEKIY